MSKRRPNLQTSFRSLLDTFWTFAFPGYVIVGRSGDLTQRKMERIRDMSSRCFYRVIYYFLKT